VVLFYRDAGHVTTQDCWQQNQMFQFHNYIDFRLCKFFFFVLFLQIKKGKIEAKVRTPYVIELKFLV